MCNSLGANCELHDPCEPHETCIHCRILYVNKLVNPECHIYWGLRGWHLCLHICMAPVSSHLRGALVPSHLGLHVGSHLRRHLYVHIWGGTCVHIRGNTCVFTAERGTCVFTSEGGICVFTSEGGTCVFTSWSLWATKVLWAPLAAWVPWASWGDIMEYRVQKVKVYERCGRANPVFV